MTAEEMAYKNMKRELANARKEIYDLRRSEWELRELLANALNSLGEALRRLPNERQA